MKQFLKTILLLTCILLVLNVVLDILFTKALNRSQGIVYREWNNIIHNTVDADLLVVGSSRAWVQYDPYIMDSVLSVNSYNLGLDASHIQRQIVKYEVYRHYQKKKPSILIINFDYWGDWEINYWQREQFFPYLVYPYIRKAITRREPFSKAELYLPMYRYYKQGIASLTKCTATENKKVKGSWYKGYLANELMWDGSRLAEIDTIRFSSLPDVVDEFDEFLAGLQKDGIKVIFVSSPIYIGATERLVNPDDFYAFRDSLSTKYNIPVLDYIYDDICYDTTYFYNATHLNKTGAQKFTMELAHCIDSLGLCSVQP